MSNVDVVQGWYPLRVAYWLRMHRVFLLRSHSLRRGHLGRLNNDLPHPLRSRRRRNHFHQQWFPRPAYFKREKQMLVRTIHMHACTTLKQRHKKHIVETLTLCSTFIFDFIGDSRTGEFPVGPNGHESAVLEFNQCASPLFSS